MGPYFSLFDQAHSIPLKHWDTVEDVEAALTLPLDLLWGGKGSAGVAVRLFGYAPRTEAAVEALRDAVAAMGESPDHLMCAAICLTLQLGDFEPGWAASENPMLSRVVARYSSLTTDGEVNPTVHMLLHDPDGTVRVEAVRTVARSDLPERNQLLQAVVDAGEPAFTCLHCGRVTPAGTSFCECHIGGAQPAAEASKALRGGDPDLPRPG